MSLASSSFRLGKSLSRGLPPRAAGALADRLADLWHALAGARRRGVRANLALAGAPPETREVFRNFTRYLVDFFRTDALTPGDFLVEGAEHLRQARAAGRGIIVLTAHLGHWELGAAALQALGLPMAGVALPHQDPDVDELFNAQRRRWGIEVIPLDAQTAARCARRLRAGGAVGVLGDMTFGGDSLPATLFGQPVLLPRGPAVLAVRTRAVVLPGALLRTPGPRRYRLVLEPPILPERLPPPAAVAAMEAACTQALERLIRRDPRQWLLMRPLQAPAAPQPAADAPVAGALHRRPLAGPHPS